MPSKAAIERQSAFAVNPMVAHPVKRCTRCGETKRNDFFCFNKKLWRSRHEFTTTDVCKACMGAAIAKKADDRRRQAAAYAQFKHDEARRQHEAEKIAQAEAERTRKDLDL